MVDVTEKELKVLICDPMDQSMLEGLKDNRFDVIYEPAITHDDLKKEIPDANILILRSRTKLTEDVLSQAKNLKIIARAGIGTDNIDMSFAKSANIQVITAAGSSTASVAELNVALAIDLSRKIPNMDRNSKALNWKKQGGREMQGKVAGIVGFGRIGLATAKILKSMGMQIIAHDIYQIIPSIAEVNGKYVTLQELVTQSDYIFVLATLTEGSVNIIDEKMLCQCKEGCFIINTSRAEIIDGVALLRSMEMSHIAGYATDVMWHEPPDEKWELQLIGRDDVIVTPHIGAQTVEAQKRVAEFTLANLFKKIEEMGL